MPRLTLELSNNILDKNIVMKDMLKDMHESLAADNFCPIAAIKTKVVRYDEYHVADGDSQKAFIMLTIAALNTRKLEILQAKGKLIKQLLIKHFPNTYAANDASITIEIREMEKELYFA